LDLECFKTGFLRFTTVLAIGGVISLYAKPIVVIDGIPIDEKVIDQRMKPYAGRLKKEEYVRKRAEYVAETIKLFLKRKFSEEKLSYIKVTEEEINESIEQIKKNMEEDPALKGISFEEVLAFQSISMKELRERQKHNIRYIKHLKSLVTEDICRITFKEHREFFNGTRVRVSMIFFSTEKKSKEAKKELLVLARQVYKQALDNPSQKVFRDLAQQHSDHPSRKNGGDIGYIRRFGDIPDTLAREAFSLDIGGISGVWTGPHGYHILQITDKQQGTRDTYRECRRDVFNYHVYREEKKLINELIREADIVFPGDPSSKKGTPEERPSDIRPEGFKGTEQTGEE